MDMLRMRYTQLIARNELVHGRCNTADIRYIVQIMQRVRHYIQFKQLEVWYVYKLQIRYVQNRQYYKYVWVCESTVQLCVVQ